VEQVAEQLHTLTLQEARVWLQHECHNLSAAVEQILGQQVGCLTKVVQQEVRRVSGDVRTLALALEEARDSHRAQRRSHTNELREMREEHEKQRAQLAALADVAQSDGKNSSRVALEAAVSRLGERLDKELLVFQRELHEFRYEVTILREQHLPDKRVADVANMLRGLAAIQEDFESIRTEVSNERGKQPKDEPAADVVDMRRGLSVLREDFESFRTELSNEWKQQTKEAAIDSLQRDVGTLRGELGRQAESLEKLARLAETSLTRSFVQDLTSLQGEFDTLRAQTKLALGQSVQDLTSLQGEFEKLCAETKLALGQHSQAVLAQASTPPPPPAAGSEDEVRIRQILSKSFHAQDRWRVPTRPADGGGDPPLRQLPAVEAAAALGPPAPQAEMSQGELQKVDADHVVRKSKSKTQPNQELDWLAAKVDLDARIKAEVERRLAICASEAKGQSQTGPVAGDYDSFAEQTLNAHQRDLQIHMRAMLDTCVSAKIKPELAKREADFQEQQRKALVVVEQAVAACEANRLAQKAHSQEVQRKLKVWVDEVGQGIEKTVEEPRALCCAEDSQSKAGLESQPHVTEHVEQSVAALLTGVKSWRESQAACSHSQQAKKQADLGRSFENERLLCEVLRSLVEQEHELRVDLERRVELCIGERQTAGESHEAARPSHSGNIDSDAHSLCENVNLGEDLQPGHAAHLHSHAREFHVNVDVVEHIKQEVGRRFAEYISKLWEQLGMERIIKSDAGASAELDNRIYIHKLVEAEGACEATLRSQGTQGLAVLGRLIETERQARIELERRVDMSASELELVQKSCEKCWHAQEIHAIVDLEPHYELERAARTKLEQRLDACALRLEKVEGQCDARQFAEAENIRTDLDIRAQVKAYKRVQETHARLIDDFTRQLHDLADTTHGRFRELADYLTNSRSTMPGDVDSQSNPWQLRDHGVILGVGERRATGSDSAIPLSGIEAVSHSSSCTTAQMPMGIEDQPRANAETSANPQSGWRLLHHELTFTE